jgi:uncharacterized protein
LHVATQATRRAIAIAWSVTARSRRMTLNTPQRRELLRLARASIDQALAADARAACPPGPWADALGAIRGSFVTLRIADELRGCCGSIDASCPLAQDVWCNAFASAFRDPRFPSLTSDEWPRVNVHISVLSELHPLVIASESALLDALEPQVDGVVLAFRGTRATFLPDVWEQLPEPQRFLRQLKLKAGWSPDFWSPDIRVWRYTTEGFGNDG